MSSEQAVIPPLDIHPKNMIPYANIHVDLSLSQHYYIKNLQRI
jgi:hypothetical protein